jgi:hypothetical protein
LQALKPNQPEVDDRLRMLARSLHGLVRHRALNPNWVGDLDLTVREIGEPVIRALREEIIFDTEFEAAIREFAEAHADDRLTAIMRRVRDQPMIKHAA